MSNVTKIDSLLQTQFLVQYVESKIVGLEEQGAVEELTKILALAHSQLNSSGFAFQGSLLINSVLFYMYVYLSLIDKVRKDT